MVNKKLVEYKNIDYFVILLFANDGLTWANNRKKRKIIIKMLREMELGPGLQNSKVKSKCLI